MSDSMIREAVRKLAGTQLEDKVIIEKCTVVSVDLSTRSCDCLSISGETETELPGVQLMAETDDGFLLIPTVGSTVFVTYSSRNAPYVSLFSSV